MRPHEPPVLTAEQLLTVQQSITRTLVSTRASQDVVQLILDQVTRSLHAHSATVSLVDPKTGTLSAGRSVGYSEGALQRWTGMPLVPGTPLTDAILTRVPLHLTAAEWDARYPQLADVRLGNMRAVAAVPLVTDGRALGAITLSWDREHAASDAERAFLENFAVQCAQTLERVELQERQQRRAQRLRKLLEFSSDIVLVLDGRGNVTYLSPSVTHTLGYTEAEFPVLGLADVIHGRDLPSLREKFREAVGAPDRSFRALFRARDRQGDWVVLEALGRNLLHDPDVRGVVCNVRDVTHTARAIQALRRSEQVEREHARRHRRLLDLVTAIDSQADPDDLAVAVLEHGLAATGFAQAYYHDVHDGLSTLRFARGEGAEAVLAAVPPAVHLRHFGRSGAALLRHDLFFADASTPIMDPPEPLPRPHWRSFCAFPVVTAGQLTGTFTFVDPHGDEVSDEHRQLLHGLADHVNVLLERRWHLRQLDASREETLRAIGRALEYRDHETKGHTDRVVGLTERLARALGFDDGDLDALRWGAYLHDTGKIATPDAILLKPGKLDAHEWDVMKRHPRIGFEMLAPIPSLPPATLAIVLHHHERWNGSGYPDGLGGTDIPLPARVFAVVDVYDALTTERPYKAAWSHEAAVAQLWREAGTLLDPDIVGVFVRMLQDAANAAS